MFADNEWRRGIVQDCRGSLRSVVLVAGLLAAAPATAAAVPDGATTLKHSAGSGARGGANLLAGSPRIGAIEALMPRRGRDAGRLIVWARVDHAPGTARALARRRPETIHSGRVVARVGKRSRFATHRLELHRSRVAHGYFLRFPKRATQALAAGVVRRVPLSLRVAQTLDLNSDGDREDRALATTSRAVQLARPATSIEPEDGTYTGTPSGDSLQVSGGAVTHYTFGGSCAAINGISAPINPSDGSFGWVVDGSGQPETTITSVDHGQFSSNSAVAFDVHITRFDPFGCMTERRDSLQLNTSPSR
jgi:hypothetical protein